MEAAHSGALRAISIQSSAMATDGRDPANLTGIISDSGKKAARNLLFFAILAVALAAGWLQPVGEGKVTLAGIGAKTTLRVIYGAVCVLITYNLIHFRQHAPFDLDPHFNRLECLFGALHPQLILEHVRMYAGGAAVPLGVKNKGNMADWLVNQMPEEQQRSGLNDKSNYCYALEAYWRQMKWRHKIRLWWHAFWSPEGKRLWWDYYVDLRFPWLVGWVGLAAASYGFIRAFLSAAGHG